MPYKRNTNTNVITGSLVACIILFKKSFPQKLNISKKLGATKILLGKLNADLNMNIMFFGYYSIVYTVTKHNMSL